VDDDLWCLLPPERRFAFPAGEESVHEWEQTVRLVEALAEGFAGTMYPLANTATTQLLWDAQARAEEALRRARERAGA
jgi:hypothetical protein